MTFRVPHKSSMGNSDNPYNMFFVSLLLHLIAIAAIILAVPGTTKTLTLGASYSVSLVGPEAIHSPRENTLPGDPVPDTLPHYGPAALRTLPRVRQDEASKQTIEKAISAIRQKDGQDSQAATASPSAESSRPAGDYTRHIWPRIKKNWVLPASLMPKENITAIIDVRIGQSGELEHIGFEKRSGNSYFDQSALRAVQKSAPFPQLAGWSAGRSIAIGIRFHSAELR